MPNAAPKPCSVCRTLVRDGTTRCAAHKVRQGSFADSRRGSRHARGYGSAWDKLRLEILARDCGLCQVCLAGGVVCEGTNVDHVVSKGEWMRRRGTLDGVDHPSNLRCICTPCHAKKTGREGAQAAALPGSPAGARAADPALTLGVLARVAPAPAQAPAWWAADPAAPGPATPGGASISGTPEEGTGRSGKFLRAGVLGGGVSLGEGAPVLVESSVGAD